MSHLVPCPECRRHVRATETVCPFCALSLDLADTPAPTLPGQRLSRAATLAFGATLASATALAACSGNETVVPVYGAPPAGSSGVDAGASAGGASGTANAGAAGNAASAGHGGATVGPVYGAPAGGSTSAAAGSSGAGPVYGAPPPQDD